MTGSLLQLMALVAHGNCYLQSSYLEHDFYPSNPVFQGCNAVTFVYSGKPINQITNPTEWFSRLKQNSCQQIYLSYSSIQNSGLPEHIAAAFANGGGNWFIIANFNNYAVYWNEHWQINDNQAHRKKIWSVTYKEVLSNEPIFKCPKDKLSTEHQLLTDILERIERFAIKNNYHSFANFFQDGLKALTSNNPTSFNLAKGLFPNNGYSLQAKQIIVASCLSWVFGGMGSWNDIPIKEEDICDYRKLTRELYSIINRCIEKGINSYDAYL